MSVTKPAAPHAHRIAVAEGLALHVADWAPAEARGALPVLCLPGLTRDSRDFEPLAEHLAGRAARPRRVLALDLRGRGRSDRAGDPTSYNLVCEAADVVAVLDRLGVARAIAVGTSRGGLVAMHMATTAPERIAGSVLNDVGPVLDAAALVALARALEATAAPTDWADAAARMRATYREQFPNASDAEWLAAARRTYVERDGRPVPAHDPRLVAGLRAIDAATALPEMWPQFAALAARPLLVLRGANSTVLSEATLAEMARRCPALRQHTVPDVGHPPPLASAGELQLIEKFCAAVDAAA